MFIHGNNLTQKMNGNKKYSDDLSKMYLKDIHIEYEKWKEANLKLKGPLSNIECKEDSEIIKKRVNLLNEYKNFLDVKKYAEKFDSRSNLHSSVLEEFMYYLFKDIVGEISPNALMGKSHSFKDIFFRASSFKDMLIKPHSVIEKKDHDFSIGVKIDSIMKCNGSSQEEKETWDIPAIAIECKTYLDKTMLQDASTAAEQLKYKNPNAKYIVVAEWLKLTNAINLKKYKIDQIYILRKQKNTDRDIRLTDNYTKNPIFDDVIYHLFNDVRHFLTNSWEEGINTGLSKGFLL